MPSKSEVSRRGRATGQRGFPNFALAGEGSRGKICSKSCGINMAEREGFEPSVQVLARTTV
jgi:hypothetical protein